MSGIFDWGIGLWKLHQLSATLDKWIVTKMIHSPSAKIRNANRGPHDSVLMLKSSPGHSAAHDLKLYFRASPKSCARINKSFGVTTMGN